VACTDLRGHGYSDATFASYGDEETAGDVIALIREGMEETLTVTRL
jgi:pimeloyl-ACP methyl ester carboxylesterase